MDEKSKENLTFNDYKEQIDIWYKAHNIIREKTELYCDFLLSLLNLIEDTYLGDDVLDNDNDILNHFKWCFDKVIENFEKERIYFIPKNGQFEYLQIFFYKAYYKSNDPNKYQNLTDYFSLLFAYNKPKTPPELKSFVEIYKLFDQNLKKIN